MANAAALLAELQSLGNEQTVKTYRRHGVTGEMYGVSYAHLGALKKRIKTDHTLARDLWASGNHDARVLATMIADPAQATDAELDRWVADVDNHTLTWPVAAIAAQHPNGRTRAERWMAHDDEWIERAGWQTVAALAAQPAGAGPDDAYFEALLPQIEAKIHGAKNRVRDAMNDAVINVGARSQALRVSALAAAQRIGTVRVDHGPTACKTPAAAPYIEKIWRRRAQRKT